jgi:hypothetical protein
MGKLQTCTICAHPVLELEGQFEVLQPYYTDVAHPALEIAGWCHSACLIKSTHAATWQMWRVDHFMRVRGYVEIGPFGGWRVLRPQRPGRLMAFHSSGCSSRFEINALRLAPQLSGGSLIPLREEMHLEFADRALTDLMKDNLRSKGSISILEVIDGLGISDRVQWPAALLDARFTDSKKLRRDWGTFAVAAIAEYAQFLPDTLADGVRATMLSS